MGQVDVDALLASLSSRQISEWMAYFALEPFGEERADLRAALIACLIANANRDEKKRPTPFRVEEFMPVRETTSLPLESAGSSTPTPLPEGRRQTWQEQKAIMERLFKRK